MSHIIADKIEFEIGTGPLLSEMFMHRVVAFYQACVPDPYGTSSIWKDLRFCTLALLEDALKAKDPVAVRVALEKIYSTAAVQGMDNIESGHYDDQWKNVALQAGIGLGIVPAYNPEQPAPVTVSLAEMLDEIECAWQVPINHKGIIGMASAIVGHRRVPYKLMEAVANTTNLMRYGNRRFILEVGAGLGWLCCWLVRTNCPDEYHIIDLPVVSVMGADRLACQFGEDRIRFKGEDVENDSHRITFHGTHPQFRNGTEFDLAVSMDAMPEMPSDDLKRYLTIIVDRLQEKGIFFGMNQESGLVGQGRVFKSMRDYTRMRQTQRNPNWHRAGYVDEMWVKE